MARTDDKEHQDCWSFLTTGEKILMFLLILAALLLFILFIGVVIMLFYNDKICNSTTCVMISSKILKFIDDRFDPCENFDQFIRKNKDEPRSVQNTIKELLNQDYSILGRNPKNFYNACRNTTAIENYGFETLRKLIDDLGWPVLLGQNWNDTDFNWLNFTTKLRNYGLKYDWFIEFDWIENDDGVKILKLSPPINSEVPMLFKKKYFDAMMKIGYMLNASKIIVEREWWKVMYFEEELHEIAVKSINISMFNDVELTVDELNTFWPQIDLVHILNDLAKGYAVFTGNSSVKIASNYYIVALNNLLGRTSRNIQANYMIWKTLENFAPYLPNNIRRAFGKYHNIKDRDQFCLDDTIRRYYNEIEEKLSGNSINSTVVNDIEEMVMRISNSRDINLIINDWEMVTSQNFAFSTDNILKMVMEEYYSRQNDFYKCLNNNMTCEYEKYSQLPKHEIVLNNITIYFPKSSILQDNIYRIDYPKFINFAGLGYKIAEIFDVESPVNAAYIGYLSWIQHHNLEKKLPAIDYSPRQLFWIWSAYINRDTIQDIIQSEYFIKDFECNR